MKRTLVSEVIDATLKVSGLTREQLLSATRRRRVSAWRQAAWAVMRESCKASTLKIGKEFGRHHSSILHGAENAHIRYPKLVAQIRCAAVPMHLHWSGRLEDLPILIRSRSV